MKNILLRGAAMLTVMAPVGAYAQSTGSIDFENDIVVTGARGVTGLGGVVLPETSKARGVLSQDIIERQVPGQSVNDIINLLPGVSFQNNDPFGSAGGTMYIRGFDNTRISQTFDGVPLNDSGGYAIYSSQQLDSELIDQVNVNLGTTDVDSPTAAATGSTVNYRTRNPTDDFSVKLVGSAGDFSFFRIFGSVDTGVFTPWGTKAFLAVSRATNDTIFNNRGEIDKKQFNAKIYQPVGDNGDFISIAGHYNEAANNRFGSVTFRNDGVGAVPSRFPNNRDERDYVIPYCQINTAATPGVDDLANTCGSTFDERVNPSKTGNIRVNSRFTLADDLILTVDPSFQYVRANGGGTAVAREGFRDINPAGTPTAGTCGTIAGVISPTVTCSVGYLGGTPYFGKDMNGDGDLRDTIRVLAPSETNTRRFGLIASLRYNLSQDQSIRLAYSLDYAKHRQTGEIDFLALNGQPRNVFAEEGNPLTDATGAILQKRDRFSKAILHQIAGEYRGKFFDALTVTAGVRAPFFKRDLNNYCATSSATGFVECFGTNTAGAAQYAALNPAIQGPQRRVLKYDKILPNVGLTYDVVDAVSVFGNYSKGLQVPGTDNLYNSFFFAPTTASAQPSPETTDNFDLGVRYRTSKVQVQASVWYTIYQNRLASAYDPETDRTLYRNLGKVDKYGVDGSISYRPIPQVVLYAFGSYLKSKIKDDVLYGECTAAQSTPAQSLITGCAAAGDPIYARTGGKRESGAPVFTVGGRAQAILGPVELGVQVKRTGPRYVNDLNQPFTLGGTIIGGVAVTGGTKVMDAKAPAYTLVDLDARLSLEFIGLNDKTYLQLNVSNVCDKLYYGGFDGRLDAGFAAASNLPFVQIGSPRTFIGSVVFGF